MGEEGSASQLRVVTSIHMSAAMSESLAGEAVEGEEENHLKIKSRDDPFDPTSTLAVFPYLSMVLKLRSPGRLGVTFH